jgi:ABC-type cobalamin transport system permease subunit
VECEGEYVVEGDSIRAYLRLTIIDGSRFVLDVPTSAGVYSIAAVLVFHQDGASVSITVSTPVGKLFLTVKLLRLRPGSCVSRRPVATR